MRLNPVGRIHQAKMCTFKSTTISHTFEYVSIRRPIQALKIIFFSCSMNLLGIPVVELSMDGRHTIDTYLNHTEGIGPNNLTDFTVCLRFNVNFLKPKFSSIISYSTFLSDNAFEFGFTQRSRSLLLYFSKYGSLGQVSTTI